VAPFASTARRCGILPANLPGIASPTCCSATKARIRPTPRNRRCRTSPRRAVCWTRTGRISRSGWGAIAERFELDPRAAGCAILGTARLAHRHGSLGDDSHAYHNETHVLEVGERRLLRLLESMGEQGPRGDDIAAC
jgi:hypothetical protein